jgi:histone deacetylase complex regulatory component SIN3
MEDLWCGGGGEKNAEAAVEFDQAIQLRENKVRDRFRRDRRVTSSSLEILNQYRKNQEEGIAGVRLHSVFSWALTAYKTCQA